METAKQSLDLGVKSFSIVALTLLFTGMVLSVQMAGVLTKYGAAFSIGGIVTIAMGRELGPVLCGVVLAGRCGAAITAELGTMRVTEQIDALRCMAVNPVAYLVVPRMVAGGTIPAPYLIIWGGNRYVRPCWLRVKRWGFRLHLFPFHSGFLWNGRYIGRYH